MTPRQWSAGYKIPRKRSRKTLILAPLLAGTALAGAGVALALDQPSDQPQRTKDYGAEIGELRRTVNTYVIPKSGRLTLALGEQERSIAQLHRSDLARDRRLKAAEKRIKRTERRVREILPPEVSFSDLEIVAGEVGTINSRIAMLASALDNHCHAGTVDYPGADDVQTASFDACDVWYEES